MVQSRAPTVDAYLAEAPPKRLEQLRKIREAARRALPDHEERMTWGRPVYVRDGAIRFGFANQKRYVSLYFMDEAPLARHAGALQGMTRGKRCLSFRESAEIDWPLVEKLIADIR